MRRSGFTLTELIIVIIIIAILALIAVPFYLGIKTKAHRSALIAEVRNYKLGQIMYHKKNGSFATTRNNLETDIIPEGFEPALNDVVIHVNPTTNPTDHCMLIYESQDDSADGRFCYYATSGMTAATCTGAGAGFTTLEIKCSF